MKVNIITQSEECIEFLSFFELLENHTMQVKYFPYREFNSFTENPLGWNSWIYMRRMFSPKSPYFKRQQSEWRIKTNIFQMTNFLKEYNTLTYEKYKSLFFTKTENEYEVYERERTEDYRDRLQKLKVTENCFGLSFNFIYKQTGKFLFVRDEDFQESFKQLKIFYASFKEKYTHSLLYLVPHYDPDFTNYITELEDRKNSWNDSQSSYNGWAELGAEEERSMDYETDGFWRSDFD